MKVFQVLLRLKAAPMALIGKRQHQASLIVIYSFIDICASLSNHKKTRNGDIFCAYVDEFMQTPSRPEFKSSELWAARNSLIHSMSYRGKKSPTNPKLRTVLYYSWPEREQEVRDVVELYSQRNCLLLDVRHLHSYSVQAFNNFQSKVEEEPEFEDLVAKNGTEIVGDLAEHRYYNFLSVIERREAKQKGR
jgi:hypothetical protein